jgi:hypothetical protein
LFANFIQLSSASKLPIFKHLAGQVHLSSRSFDCAELRAAVLRQLAGGAATMACKTAFILTATCFLAAWQAQAQQSERASSSDMGSIGGSGAHQREGSAAGQRAPGKEAKIVTGPNLPAAQQLPEVPNPVAIQIETSMLAVLASQKQAVDSEVMSQMKLGIGPVAVPPSGGSQTMASRGGPLLGAGASRTPTTTTPKSAGGASAATTPSSATGATGSGSMSMAGGATINPPLAGSANSKFGNMPANAAANVALTCSANPTMRILNVAGTPAPAVFTPIAAYNLYAVSGCSFGNPGPDAKAYIYKGGTFRENLQIQEWHDNWLKLSLDSKISGVLDQDDVTLVIQRADGTQASKSGFRFRAVRSLVPLPMIPSRWVHLVTWSKDQKTFSPEYSSPAIIEGKAAGPSAYVSRYVDGEKFDPGAQPPDQQYDSYDLSGLAAGWVGKSAQLRTFPMTCGTKYQPIVKTYDQHFGAWRTEWSGNTLRVYLADESCSGFDAAFPLVNYQNLTGSYYRLTVVAYGPRCTDPLTGKPDQACMQRVQQGAP